MQPKLEKDYFTLSLLWKLQISVLIWRYKYKYLVQLGENPSVCFHLRYISLAHVYKPGHVTASPHCDFLK